MVVVAALATTVLLGITLLSRSSHRVSAKQSAGPVTTSVPPPAGTGTTSAGPDDVAEMIVSREPLLVSEDETAALALVDGWAIPSHRTGLEQQVLAARNQFETAPGGPFTFDASVLATRDQPQSSGVVTVDSWCVEVLFRRGAPVSELFLTEALGLTQWQGGWRLTSLTETPGPSVPVSGVPTPAAEAAGALTGFGPAIVDEGHP